MKPPEASCGPLPPHLHAGGRLSTVSRRDGSTPRAHCRAAGQAVTTCQSPCGGCSCGSSTTISTRAAVGEYPMIRIASPVCDLGSRAMSPRGSGPPRSPPPVRRRQRSGSAATGAVAPGRGRRPGLAAERRTASRPMACPADLRVCGQPCCAKDVTAVNSTPPTSPISGTSVASSSRALPTAAVCAWTFRW